MQRCFLTALAVLSSGPVACTASPRAPVSAERPRAHEPSTSSTASHASSTAPRVGRLAGGREFGCAIGEEGEVWCWGRNEVGELGVAGPSSANAIRVAGLGEAVDIGAAWDHACAVLSNGEVWCWGRDGFACVSGAPTPGRVDGPRLPVRVPLPKAARAVSTADYHTCALLDDGSVWCWGRNTSGELAHSATPSPPAPEGSPPGVSSVPPGSAALAVLQDVSSPVRVQGLPGPATALAAYGHRTAVVVDGEVWWWGAGAERLDRFSNDNPYASDMGIPPEPITLQEMSPRRIDGPSGVRRIVLTHDHGFFLTESGGLWGWGRAPHWLPPLERPHSSQDPERLTFYHELHEIVDVASSRGGVCVRLSDDSIRCWGNDPFASGAGIRGNGTHTTDAPPSTVPGIRATAIGAGDDFMCAAGRGPDGTQGLWAWGLAWGPSFDQEGRVGTTTPLRIGFLDYGPGGGPIPPN